MTSSSYLSSMLSSKRWLCGCLTWRVLRVLQEEEERQLYRTRHEGMDSLRRGGRFGVGNPQTLWSKGKDTPIACKFNYLREAKN